MVPDTTADILFPTATDSHVHTRLCCHATGEMEEYVTAAIGRGLDGLIFLEHMEEGIDNDERTWLTEQDFDSYFTEGKRLQGKYKKELQIGLGVECGYNPEHQQAIVSRLGSRDWDDVGVSCHFIDSPGGHINLFSRKEQNLEKARKAGPKQLLDTYFDTLLEAVVTLPGSKLCHLDGALRFLPTTRLTDSHLEKINRLLLAVKKKGMSLEVNSSGFDIRGEQFPSHAILEMAISLQIPLTAGSDAHKPEQVGRHFEQMKKLVSTITSASSQP